MVTAMGVKTIIKVQGKLDIFLIWNKQGNKGTAEK